MRPRSQSYNVQILPPLAVPALGEVAVAAPDPTPLSPTAVLVCHGMGQQVRFETLEQFARVLARYAGGQVIGIRRVRIGSASEDLYRVELHAEDETGARREIHVYEAYWAPLTEGKVGLSDVIGFLLGAAWNGFRHVEGPEFTRWMFGGKQWLPIRATSTRTRLLAALAVVVGLITVIGGSGAVGIARWIAPGRTWPGDRLLHLLVWDLAIVWIALLAPVLTLLFQKWRGKTRMMAGQARDRYHATWVGIWAALGAIVLVAGAMIVQGISTALDRSPFTISGLERAGFAISWLMTFALGAGVRYFLVQYVGDVTAYIESHSSNKFFEVRSAIQRIAFDAARSIYRALAPEGDRFAYGSIVMVGHSLGSVVAYDALNAVLREDPIASPPIAGLERTRGLLTFGSPLNKTAFLFSTQMRQGDEIREGLATAVQPLIQSYDFRPPVWVNLYSPSDWIGGRLEFYDDPTGVGGSKRVRNRIDHYAATPLAAHTEHWQSPALVEAVLSLL